MVVSELIDRYLDGAATQEEVRQLDELLRQDAAARESLFSAASLEMCLRRCMVGDSSAAAQANPPPSGPTRRPSWWKSLTRYAAVLIVALTGWAAAAIYAVKFGEGRDELAQARTALAGLHNDHDRPIASQPKSVPREDELPRQPDTIVASHPFTAGRVIQTRGAVWTLPAAGQPALQVSPGSAIPAGRAMRTCPWGSATMSFADGDWMQLDRNSIVAFSEDDGLRHARVEKGIFYVTQRGGDKAGRFIVTTPQASVDVVDAEVTVAIEGDRTIVEVSRGRAEVACHADGRRVAVPVGHYVVISPDSEKRAVQGSVAFRLETSMPTFDPLEGRSRG